LRPVASGVARLLAVRAPVSVTTSTIMIEPSAPGRAFVNHAFGVVSTRSEGFVFAVLARAFAGEDLGAPSLGFIPRNILPTRTTVVAARTASLAAPVALAEATSAAARFRPATATTIVALATFVVVRVVG
jgi:hypothetical protein